jgi:hypothetical protein
MKNPKDYAAGYTKRIFNEETGKYSSGGAARNRRIALKEGVSAIEEEAFIGGVKYIQPLLESYQNELHSSKRLLKKMAQIINSYELKRIKNNH